MNLRHAAALALVGWYLLIPPVFSPMGNHPRAFNDLNASLDKWDIWAPYESETSCKKEKERIQNEAPLRLKFAHEHPDQDRNGNIVAVAEAWQRAECIATEVKGLDRGEACHAREHFARPRAARFTLGDQQLLQEVGKRSALFSRVLRQRRILRSDPRRVAVRYTDRSVVRAVPSSNLRSGEQFFVDPQRMLVAAW